MLKERVRVLERAAKENQRRHQVVKDYGEFLRDLFNPGDWFMTITFRDRFQDVDLVSGNLNSGKMKRLKAARRRRRGLKKKVRKCPQDPRIENWEPQSRYRRAPGPPVRDASLREIEHFLLELGWESAGRTRQEIFDWLTEGLDRQEKTCLAKRICKSCLICTLLRNPIYLPAYQEIYEVATRTIGWAIAEEFGRVGGRWHVHLLVRGTQHIRRKKWWKRAFMRFGRNRIEAIHE